MKRKIFQFEPKIGWSELIAFSALVIAVISFYASYQEKQTNINIVEGIEGTGSFHNKNKNEWAYFSYFRILVTNNGNKTISLIGLIPPLTKPFPNYFAGSVKDGKAKKINTKVVITDTYLDSIKQYPDRITKLKYYSNEELSILNRSINPGETEILNIGIIYDVYDGTNKKTDSVFTSVKLIFSDGSNYLYKRAFKVESPI